VIGWLALSLVASPACRTTTVEVQVYVQGVEGDPLDTATQPPDDTSATTDTAPPRAPTQGVLAVDRDGGTASVSFNPAGVFDGTAEWSLPDLDGRPVWLADLDGDSLDDLWVRGVEEKTLTVWLQQSEGGFAETPAWDGFTNISEVREVVGGDFDGDGLGDLAAWVEESHLVHVWPGTGVAVDLGDITDSSLSEVFDGRWAVADVDADGRDDLVRIGDDQVAAWRSEGLRFARDADPTATLDTSVDLLLEADGLFGADLARATGGVLEIRLAGAEGWGTEPDHAAIDVDGELLAGLLGPI